jgi:hypothetical protein
LGQVRHPALAEVTDDEQAASDIFAHVERLASDGQTHEAAAIAQDLARSLGETSRSERPAMFAQRELSRIWQDARDFLHGAGH